MVVSRGDAGRGREDEREESPEADGSREVKGRKSTPTPIILGVHTAPKCGAGQHFGVFLKPGTLGGAPLVV